MAEDNSVFYGKAEENNLENMLIYYTKASMFTLLE